MTMIFYPHDDDLESSSMEQRLEIMLTGAERYKAAVLDVTTDSALDAKKPMTPREVKNAYNWQELAKLLRQISKAPWRG